MTVTVYADFNIRPELIKQANRTWSNVWIMKGVTVLYVLEFNGSGIGMAYTDYSEAVVASSDLMTRFKDRFHKIQVAINVERQGSRCMVFEFDTQAAAMAFRLRYSDYLTDAPRDTVCDELMALEAE